MGKEFLLFQKENEAQFWYPMSNKQFLKNEETVIQKNQIKFMQLKKIKDQRCF